jgi:hypothetical protein
MFFRRFGVVHKEGRGGVCLVCDYVYEISVDEMKMRSNLVVNLLILFTAWNLYVA